MLLELEVVWRLLDVVSRLLDIVRRLLNVVCRLQVAGRCLQVAGRCLHVAERCLVGLGSLVQYADCAEGGAGLRSSTSRGLRWRFSRASEGASAASGFCRFCYPSKCLAHVP